MTAQSRSQRPVPKRVSLRQLGAPSLASAAAAALICAVSPKVDAQEATRIVAATVYPDSANVERELEVPGGTRHIAIACIPASADVSTLQVDGDPDVRVGDIRATALPATRAQECAMSSTEARRTALALQRAALEAQHDSTELALSYLKLWGSNPHAEPPAIAAPAAGHAPTPANASRPGATAGDLRRAALELLTDQARVKRELAALDREEAKLADEQPITRGKDGWRTVRFDVWTAAPATLRVHYNVVNTYWRPTYRASVDVARSTLRLDRQADIVQASGEDWSDVKVKLSTGRVHRAAQGDLPSSWWLNLLVADMRSSRADATLAFAPAAPAPAMSQVEVAGAIRQQSATEEPPPWRVDIAGTDYATEFIIAQAVTLPSDGETRTLQIASQSMPATLKRRTTPRTDRAIYLLVDADRPAGVWPAGPLQSYRDGTLVGRTNWQPARGDKLEIGLGQDDQMHVDVESPGGFTCAAGLFDSRIERSSSAVYAIVNDHPTPVAVEMLDAAPVSGNALIKATHKYEPSPATTEWDKRRGVAAWTLTIPPKQAQRVSVTHVVTYPKDAAVAGLP